MSGIHGIFLMATGLLHVLVSLTPKAYLKDWSEIKKQNFWKQVTLQDDRRMAAFWFLFGGPLFFVIGYLIYFIEMQGIPMPAAFGWMLLGLGVFGSILTPKSGFTILVLPQAIFYLMSAMV